MPSNIEKTLRRRHDFSEIQSINQSISQSVSQLFQFSENGLNRTRIAYGPVVATLCFISSVSLPGRAAFPHADPDRYFI